MKKKILIIAGLGLMLIVGLAGTFLGSKIAEAASGIWNSCDRGRVDCAYPGECRSYIDTNKDAICDRSQSNPALKAAVASSSNSISDLNTAASSSSGLTISSSNVQANASDILESQATTKNSRSYYLFPILAILIILYSLTWFLSNKKIINSVIHRRIWNTILLISAAISALLGFVLILNIDLNTGISLPFNMLFWHVEAGIAFGIIAVFHVFWHRRYFAKMLKVSSNITNQELNEPGKAER